MPLVARFCGGDELFIGSGQVGGATPSLVVLPGRAMGLRKIRKKSPENCTNIYNGICHGASPAYSTPSSSKQQLPCSFLSRACAKDCSRAMSSLLGPHTGFDSRESPSRSRQVRRRAPRVPLPIARRYRRGRRPQGNDFTKDLFELRPIRTETIRIELGVCCMNR